MPYHDLTPEEINLLREDVNAVPKEPQRRSKLLRDDGHVPLTVEERNRLLRYVGAVEDRRGYR